LGLVVEREIFYVIFMALEFFIQLVVLIQMLFLIKKNF